MARYREDMLDEIYIELSNSVEEKLEITENLTEQINKHGQNLLYMASSRNHPKVINFLFEQTNYKNWFEPERFKKFLDPIINDILNESVFSLKQYRWCMSIEPINQTFTPQEKGKWLMIGLIINDYPLTYHASKDGSWNCEIDYDTISLEINRLISSKSIHSPNSQVTDSYLNWFSQNLIKNLNTENQKSLLLSLFIIASDQYNLFNQLKGLIDLDMYIDSQETLSTEKVLEQYEVSKSSVLQLQEQILWKMWPSESKQQCIQIIKKYTNSSSLSDTKDLQKQCKDIINNVKSVFLMNQFEQDLQTANSRSSVKKL